MYGHLITIALLTSYSNAVVAPPPPNADAPTGKKPDLKIRIALGLVGGVILLVLLLLLCCCVKLPLPRESRRNDERQDVEHAMSEIPQRVDPAPRYLHTALLDKHFPPRNYCDWSADCNETS